MIVFDEVEDVLPEAVLEAVLEREFAGSANISVPPANSFPEESAEMSSPSTVTAGAPGTTLVPSKIM